MVGRADEHHGIEAVCPPDPQGPYDEAIVVARDQVDAGEVTTSSTST